MKVTLNIHLTCQEHVLNTAHKMIVELWHKIHTPRRNSVTSIRGLVSVTAPRNWTIFGCLSFISKLTSCLKSWLQIKQKFYKWILDNNTYTNMWPITGTPTVTASTKIILTQFILNSCNQIGWITQGG
jgi:hypothetical protein